MNEDAVLQWLIGSDLIVAATSREAYQAAKAICRDGENGMLRAFGSHRAHRIMGYWMSQPTGAWHHAPSLIPPMEPEPVVSACEICATPLSPPHRDRVEVEAARQIVMCPRCYAGAVRAQADGRLPV